MAYSVDWIAKVITVPTSDLTLVSGTHYSLQMQDFLVEIRRLEAAFDEGLWAPQILDHADDRPDFAGVNYAGFDEVINGYTVQVTGVATRVDLIGTNNNIIDVLIPTGVSVVPSNSAGLQVVSTGSGLSPSQDNMLTGISNQLHSIEGGIDHAQLMRMLFSGMCCKIDGAVTGQAGTAHFRDMMDSKNRMTVEYDAHGNRLTVSWDMS